MEGVEAILREAARLGLSVVLRGDGSPAVRGGPAPDWLLTNLKNRRRQVVAWLGPAGVVARLWPALLGILPLSAAQAIDDLSHEGVSPEIDADAERLRGALAALAGSPWPPPAADLEVALVSLDALEASPGGFAPRAREGTP